MWLPSGLPFMLGLFLCLSSGSEAQSRRPASRVFTTNIKSSSNSDFNCPEEFGYYPHPTDCSQYYVCVFGGALLESCTGGLMYSHELQTCDWPRNVGCELSDNIAPSAIDREVTPRIPHVQTIQPQKFRFSSPSGPSSSAQGIPARVHAIPPPPELKVAPNPVITSRGQPKFEQEKNIAQLYAEAHETLPPVEEEESDRQQRVYRGQPSTVTQVQRDRDGLLHQPSVNAIPTQGKIGSFAFGSQINQHSDQKRLLHPNRIRRDIETETYTNESLVIETSSPTTINEYKRSPRQLRPPSIARSPWQFGNNDQYSNDKPFQPRLTVNQNYNPFLTVPQSTNSSPYFKPREQSNNKPEYNPYANSYSKANNAAGGGEQAVKTSQPNSNPYSNRYVDQDNYFSHNFKASTKDPLYPDTQNIPIYSNNAKPKFKPAYDDRLPDNFSFFHFGNDDREQRKIISPQEFVNKLPNVAVLPNATPKNHYISFSTVGGFYNNQPTTQSPIDDYKGFSKFRQSNTNAKLSLSTQRPNVYHSSPAPVYESTDDYYDYDKGAYVGSFYPTSTQPPQQQYSTPPRIFYQPITTTQRPHFYNKHQELSTTYAPQYEYPTTQPPLHRQYPNSQTTTQRVTPDITSHTYYPVNVAFQQIDAKEHHKSPAIFKYHVVKDDVTKPTQKTQRFFVTKKSNVDTTTPSPPPPTTTQKYSTIKLGDDFTGPLVGLDFDFNKFVAGIRETHLTQLDAKIANHYKDRPLDTTTSRKSYVDISRATTTARSIPELSTWKPSVEATTVAFGSRAERTTWRPTTKLNKLLETGGLVNTSTPKPFFKYTALSNDFRYQTSTAPTTVKPQTTTLDSDEYYYEDDEEEEEEEKEQVDVLKQKPTPTTSVRPSTRSPKGYESFINSIPKKPTTKLQLVNNETSDDDDDEYYYDEDEDDDVIHSPPAIKSQFVPLSETMAPRPPTTPSYRNSSYHTHFPFLQHTTPSSDSVFNRNQQTATIPSFITFPKDIFQDIKPLNNIQRYLNHSTLRPYTKRTRLGSTSAPEFTTEFVFTPTARTTTLPPTTTTTQTSTTTRKIYTIRPNRGQSRWKLQKSIDGTKNKKNLLEYDDKVGNRVEQSTQSPTVYIQQPSSRLATQNNRNYYNTTNSNQGYTNPSQFDSYYSVYDEDVELYRDIDYGQQYTTTVTQKPTQSTYRPSTMSTQPPPPRETYVKQEQVYEQRPVSSYNPDYDEALIAQLEGDSTYDHPPRNQLRGNEINSISDNQFVVTSTRSPNVGYSSTTYTPTKQIYTTLSTTASPQITSTRSTLLDDDNNTTSETIILKLSTRAGIPAALVPSNPNNIPSHSPLIQSNRNNQPSEINVQVLPNDPIPDSNKTKNPTRLIRTNDNIDAKIISLSSGYQTRSRKADSVVSTTSLPSDIDSQRQKILSFVVSDAQPQSFQPRPSTTSTPTTTTTTITTSRPQHYSEQLGEELDSQNSFVNRQSSIKSYPTTTTNAPNIFISGIHLPANRLPKTENIKLVLTSGLRDVSNEEIQQPDVEQGSVEIVPLYIRESNGKPLVDATVEPTTYAPAKPFRSIRRPAIQRETIAELDSQDGEESMTNIQQRPYEQNLESAADVPTPASPSKLVSKFSYKYLDDRNYRNKPSSVYEPAPYFTSRSNNFKEVLNKTYETSTTSKLFVSPYTSLRSILQDESVKSTSLRPVIRPSPISNKNQTLPSSSSPPSLRSYYSITGTPRSILTSSTTQRLIKTSTPEPPTTTSTESTTTTTKSTIPTTTIVAPSDQWIPLSSTEIDRYIKSPKFLQHGNRNQYQSFSTTENSVDNDEPTTYPPNQLEHAYRRKVIRTRPLYVSSTPPPVQYDQDDDAVLDVIRNAQFSKLLESVLDTSSNKPKKYETRRVSNQAVPITTTTTEQYPENIFDSTTRLIEITDRPHQYFSHYRHLSTERTVGSAIHSSTQRYANNTTPKLSDEELREKFRATVEMPEFNIPTESERKLYKNVAAEDDESDESDLTTLTNTINELTTQSTSTTTITAKPSRTTTTTTTTTTEELPVPSTSTTPKSSSTTNSINTIPPRASRVNAAIKTTIAAASLPRRATTAPVTLKCTENSPNAKCNEIPSRTNSNTRNRGASHFSTASGDDRPATVAVNRGTHPPRSRPTLKPSGTIVSKAQEFVDIYRNPPTRPEPLYPQPTPDKTAARCRKDVCLLPDCSCGGKEIPGNLTGKLRNVSSDSGYLDPKLPAAGDLNVESVPQIVLLTFDDSVNDLNKQLYSDLFDKGRVNPNGCPISATFYVSHEWTDYSQVQNLYSDGHEMASHTVSHSFGEQFSQKKWTREVAGQREILAAYGGVKLNDVRGMRAPFLSVGGNKMFKMLYDSNFTYDSSMPVYENRPPSWPYTLDYKIFHDCMIPPCPTKSYPGVWQVPMVMWQDLNGGRCSMGDACANPPESDGVFKMLMKNFDRHYSTNRAPFGLFYHAAWFTQPHHKEGFIKFLDNINAMNDVWIVTNWQALQWVRDPTPIERINQFQPFQCDYSDRPKRCNNAKICNLWHKSGVRYMRTCQPCPEIYPWTGKTGIRSSRVDNDIEE